MEELYPYTQVNDPLPAHLEAPLATHLNQLSSTIAVLDTEIDDLERQLNLKKEARFRIAATFEAYLSLKSPLRKTPPEVLALIFGHVLGTKAFCREQYLDYFHLRGVCKTWRDVVEATPHLCGGLEISLDNVNGQCRRRRKRKLWDDEELGDVLAPWLEIVARSPCYHLIVKDEGSNLHSGNIQPILRRLLIAQHSPAKLTIESWLAAKALLELDVVLPNVQSLEIKEITDDAEYDLEGDLFALNAIFPRLLSALIAGYRISIHRPPSSFIPLTLQKLHLEEVVGDVTSLLQAIPNLKELKLGSKADSIFPESTSMSFVSPSLETLILVGQDWLASVQDISFPSLRLLFLVGMNINCPQRLIDQCIPHFFQRFEGRQDRLTVSLRGCMESIVLEALINHLPPRTRLLYDVGRYYPDQSSWTNVSIESDHIDEIFCTDQTGDLHWLNRVHCRKTSTSPIKLYVPSSRASGGWLEAVRGDVGALGYNLEVQPQDVLNAMLRSSAPHTDVEWI